MMWLFPLTLLIGIIFSDGFVSHAAPGDTAALLDETRLVPINIQTVIQVPFTAPSDKLQAVAAEVAGLPSPDHLVLINDGTDAFNLRHVRFQQVRPFRGGSAVVYGGDFILHIKSDGVYAASGMVVPRLDVVLPPSVTRQTAAGRATAEAQRRLSHGLAARLPFASVLQLLVVPRADGDQVVWCGDGDHSDDPTHPGILRVCIEGHGAGAVRESRNVLQTAAATGKATGYYYHPITIGTNSIATGYEMLDPTRGNFQTRDMRGTTANTYPFVDVDNVWGNGTKADSATGAVDAHYGIQMTWDFFQTVLGRNGIRNDGVGASNRVHYGTKYNNAYWTDSCFCMTYGDGDGTTFDYFAALDVAGHEMMHGVTSNTAKLIYSGESGGLNEAMSDMFGTLVEFYAKDANDPGDYCIGEKVYLAKPCLRYMDEPFKDGSSPNCWKSTIGSLDVHYSSGPANHFFYLLAEQGKTSACNGAFVTGVGRDKATQIIYRALTTYMTSSTNYAAARKATIRAAQDLYGDLSTEAFAVHYAWSAVAVVGAPPSTRTPTQTATSTVTSTTTMTATPTATASSTMTSTFTSTTTASPSPTAIRSVLGVRDGPAATIDDSPLLATGSNAALYGLLVILLLPLGLAGWLLLRRHRRRVPSYAKEHVWTWEIGMLTDTTAHAPCPSPSSSADVV